MLGLNPSQESTAHDKYDDGQKLFGVTDCPPVAMAVDTVRCRAFRMRA